MNKLLWNTLVSAVLFLTVMPVNAQTDTDQELKQYLFPAFVNGTLKMKDGTSRDLILNYNTITEKFVFIQNNDLFDLADTNPVDTIIIETRRFVPVDEVFLEVLVDATVALFVQNKSNLTEPGSPAGYGTTSQTSSIRNYSSYASAGKMLNLELPSGFTVTPAPVFWIRNGDEMFSFQTRRQLLKHFPDNGDEINKFIKNNRFKTNKSEDLIKIIQYCNEFIK